MIRATCPATEPTAPAAADTTTVSPRAGFPTSTMPTHAVSPGEPSTPSAVETGARDTSTASTASADTTGCVCQPVSPQTMSPGTKRRSFDATTSLTARPITVAPGAAAVP